MTKLCKDCNWYKNNDYFNTGSGIYDECLCPEIKPIPNPVTGNSVMKFCRVERLNSGECGPEGKYWMEKQPPETKKQFWSRFFNFG